MITRMAVVGMFKRITVMHTQALVAAVIVANLHSIVALLGEGETIAQCDHL